MSPAPWKGPQKVAALLMSLDPEMAAGLLTMFDEQDIAEVGTAMATLDPATLDEANVGMLHKEFVDSMIQDTGPEAEAPPPPSAVLEGLLEMALPPDQARQIRTRIENFSRKSRPFINLEKLKLDTLRKVLDGEHPQILALVCAKMSPDTTAAILGGFPDEQRNDVVRRMAGLENAREEYVGEVVAALEAKANSFKPTAAAAAAAPGQEEVVEEEEVDPIKRLRTVVEILKTVDVDTEKSILKGLEEKDPELVKQIKEQMFTFEDLAILEKKTMQKILTGFDIRVLAIALKAADPAVEANFINNMSKRVQAMLAEERELLAEVSVEDITNAQKEILTTVRAMIDSGDVVIPRKGQANAKPK